MDLKSLSMLRQSTRTLVPESKKEQPTLEYTIVEKDALSALVLDFTYCI